MDTEMDRQVSESFITEEMARKDLGITAVDLLRELHNQIKVEIHGPEYHPTIWELWEALNYQIWDMATDQGHTEAKYSAAEMAQEIITAIKEYVTTGE